jgi:hypothetical protein
MISIGGDELLHLLKDRMIACYHVAQMPTIPIVIMSLRNN